MDNKIAILAGTLIDGTGRDPVSNAVILIDDKTITAIGGRSKTRVPAGFDVIDASDKIVMPGMFDAHVHIASYSSSIERELFIPRSLKVFETASMMKRTLHAGFTTIRDAWGLEDVGYRTAVERGLIDGPRMILAGGVGQTGGHMDRYFPSGVTLPDYSVEMADGVAAAQRAARQVLRKGYDFVKVCNTGGVASPADSPEYTEWTMDELKAIVYEAKARGKQVMSHAEGNAGIKLAIRGGVWSVEHGNILDDEAIDLFLKHGTYLVPTMYVFEDMAVRGKEMGMTEVSLAKVEMVRSVHARSFRMAAEAGVKIGVGTDIIDEGSHGRNAKELELMVRNGFSSMQAIVAATRTSAEICRIGDKVGTLETGKLADLLVVDGDPLADIRVLQQAERLLVVMKEGKQFVDRDVVATVAILTDRAQARNNRAGAGGMATRQIEVVEIQGTPRQRGRIHGEACRTLIHEFVERWKGYFGERFGLSPAAFISEFVSSTGFAGAIERWTPGLLDEVRGISEGCGLDFSTTFFLSCYDEIWWYYRDRPASGPPSGDVACTALGVFGQPGLPPIIAQNLDVGNVYDGSQVLLRIKHTDGTPDALVYTFAGCVAMNGLNDRAVGICANTLSELDHSSVGLPVAFVHRGVLAQPTYEKAVAFCKNVPHASGQNYTIGGPQRVIDLECSAHKVSEFLPVPGIDRVFHTNHSIVNDDRAMFQRHLAGLGAAGAERMEILRENTACRYNTAERHIMDPSRPVTVADIESLLRSHEEPWSVCVHIEQGFTSGSMVMVLSTPPELNITFGPPCDKEYQVFRF